MNKSKNTNGGSPGWDFELEDTAPITLPSSHLADPIHRAGAALEYLEAADDWEEVSNVTEVHVHAPPAAPVPPVPYDSPIAKILVAAAGVIAALVALYKALFP